MIPTPDIIRSLPKVLLHDHLDGGLRVSTIIEIARKENISIPSEDPGELLDWFHRGANQGDLGLYLETFKVIYDILQTEEALERVAYESLLDLKADNVVYAELRFAPFFHTRKDHRGASRPGGRARGAEKGVDRIVRDPQRGAS